jgi:hypothetical protein
MGESSTEISPGQGLLHGARKAMHVQSDGIVEATAAAQGLLAILAYGGVYPALSVTGSGRPTLPASTVQLIIPADFTMRRLVLCHLRPSPDWSL